MNHVFMGQDCSKADIVPLKFADLGIYRFWFKILLTQKIINELI